MSEKSEGQQRYESLVDQMVLEEKVSPGKWFGAPGLMANGYIFACLYDDDMVFKLRPTDVQRALTLEGARLFDPMEDGRAMKEWVQIPARHADHWRDYAHDALEYIREFPPKAPKRGAKKK